MRSVGPDPKEIEPGAVEEAEAILEAAGIEPDPPVEGEDVRPTREPDAPGSVAAEAEAEKILAAAEKADVLGPIAATEG